MIIQRTFIGKKSLEEIFQEFVLHQIDKMELSTYHEVQANIAPPYLGEDGGK